MISCPSSTCAPACLARWLQNRLEPRLGDEQPPARADRFDACIEAADDVGELLARQSVHRDDGAFGQELLVRLRA